MLQTERQSQVAADDMLVGSRSLDLPVGGVDAVVGVGEGGGLG